MAGTLVAGALSTGSASVNLNEIVRGTVKAWVNFDGAASPIAIRDSFNVSSITDNGVGNHTINFATPLSHDNFVVLGTAIQYGGSTQSGARIVAPEGTSKAASHNVAWARIGVVDNNSDAMLDASGVGIAIIG